MLRFVYILFLLIKYFFSYIFSSTKNSVAKPKLLRNFLEDAGGAFIKFGQLLALRIDMLPKEYFLELIDLYDNVRPFSYQEVERIITYELGSSPDKIFPYFEKTPFASASFGQVHAAKVKNEKVIVKIQRPGIQEIIRVDFFIIDILSLIADMFFKIEALPWKDFAQEFKTWTRKELNYQIEAENTQKIYDNLKGVPNSSVVIPKTYHLFTTKKILVQEYLDGIPLSRILRGLKDGRLSYEKLKRMGIDIKKAPITLDIEMMREYFFDGFFHADLHPGNILLLDNRKIGLIDFGIVGESAPKREMFLRFAKAAAEAEKDESQYEKMGYYFLEFAGDSLKQIIGSVMPANADESYLTNFYHLLAENYADMVKDIQMNLRNDIVTLKTDHAAIFIRMLKYAQRYQIKLPKEMSVFIRGLSIIGFLGKELDYDFHLTDVVLGFCEKYPIESIPHYASTAPYKRMNREEAIDRLNSWLAYLVEIDPKLYQLVEKYISKYNETKLNA